MKLYREEREPTKNERRFPWHTRPMADSLAVLDDAGLLEYATAKVGTITLTVKLRRPWDEGPGGAFYCCATDVHKLAAEVRDYTRICAL